jgi:protocatechuate 3,4-dioxygenase beta subunit
MSRKWLGVAVLVVALILGAIVWKQHRSAPSTTATEGGAAHAPARSHAAPPTPASISGRVTAHGGGPIAGAVVALARSGIGIGSDDHEPPRIEMTDAGGSWHVDSVVPGKYVVSATARGFLPGSLAVAVAAGEQRRDVAIELAPGGTILRGTVTEVGGGPLAGVHIEVRSERFMLGDQAAFVAMTGADGRYELALARGGYSVGATRDDYAPAHGSVVIGDRAIVKDFQLVPGATITGKVIARDTRKPVAGATVTAQSGHGRRSGSTTAIADQDGNFMVHGLRSGAVSIAASGPGYASNAPTVVEVGVGEQVANVRVVVDRAHAITGHVVRATDHKGLAGVRVAAFTMSGADTPSPSDPTGDDGAFEIVGVKRGSYILFAMAEGWLPDVGKTVEVNDRDPADVTIELEGGVTLSGRIDPPGAAQLSVTMAGDVGISRLFEVFRLATIHGDADATGVFTVHNVPAGSLTLVARTSEGNAGKLPVVVSDKDQADLVVHIDTLGSISGHVIDTHGAPVAGEQVIARAKVERQSFSMNDQNMSSTSTDDGSFRIAGVEAGTYHLMSEGEQLAQMLGGSDVKPLPEVVIAAGEAKTGVTVTVPAKDGVIRGSVVDADGNPVADAWVTGAIMPASDAAARMASAMELSDLMPQLSGSDGRFVLDHLRDGAYKLVAEGPRGASRAEQDNVKPGDTPRLQLATLGSLHGQVTSAGAAVTAYDLSCTGPAGVIDRGVDASDGSYLLDRLAPGHYACNADADAGTGAGNAEVGTTSTELDLVIVGWATVTGTVVSVRDGQPVPNLNVLATPDSNMTPRGLLTALTGGGPKTDATGKFAVPQVPQGQGKVTLFAPDAMAPLATQPYTAVSGQTVDVGVIKVVPPRQGDAGTFGLSVAPDDQGLSVTNVTAGGPAAQAGVIVGDHVAAIDGHTIAELTPQVAGTLLSSGSIGIGEQVTLTLARGTSVTLTSVKW